jgi:hypothetical protein
MNLNNGLLMVTTKNLKHVRLANSMLSRRLRETNYLR